MMGTITKVTELFSILEAGEHIKLGYHRFRLHNYSLQKWLHLDGRWSYSAMPMNDLFFQIENDNATTVEPEKYTVMKRILEGKAKNPKGAVDDAIDTWHKSSPTYVDLPTYLGMSESEYALFVEDADSLSELVEARKAAAEGVLWVQVFSDVHIADPREEQSK